MFITSDKSKLDKKNDEVKEDDKEAIAILTAHQEPKTRLKDNKAF